MLKTYSKPANVFCFSVKPTGVSILDKISHLSADKEIEVTCQAVGGYPSPKLTWWLGSKILRHFDEVRCLKLCRNLVSLERKYFGHLGMTMIININQKTFSYMIEWKRFRTLSFVVAIPSKFGSKVVESYDI